ncbi:hypothetical protein EON67_02485 [archaeon]|nr:MAG: hypothetical protein EON67_02485 [archaeon]
MRSTFVATALAALLGVSSAALPAAWVGTWQGEVSVLFGEADPNTAKYVHAPCAYSMLRGVWGQGTRVVGLVLCGGGGGGACAWQDAWMRNTHVAAAGHAARDSHKSSTCASAEADACPRAVQTQMRVPRQLCTRVRLRA